ncbi:multifunctional CCA addition/repair protein [Crenobacter sp. SG2303]|uniref:Multifunctional CCA protein n=1 Tax=Crenobacter oryzisoli TaxID=3056844 RepID=A0ABT7XID5_9NEIS|nr:multifunctional CCA addition/repair protein [Crenobacter sp. SG2303]MDN0073526.1 multifunctional CCA addition/repair protein [Crenobacter sp. SG2303]
MKAYIVGGAVRDRLLGLPVRDHDWVVVGTTPKEMLDAGFLPVGKDFPVFLHPKTQEEYALARTERKTAPGYHGFSFHAAPDVTLNDDLARRDLTINAMAEDEHGNVIDPYHGQADLEARVLRHVSPAFAEDPVRILRLARFAARFGFETAPETQALMRQMVEAGEVDALVAERVWQELGKGLMEDNPSRMFRVLRDCGALARLIPELDALAGVPQRADYHPEIDTFEHVMLVLDTAARLNAPLPVRFAALCHDFGKALTPADILPRHHGHDARGEKPVLALCERLRVPTDCRDLARLVTLYHIIIHQAGQLRPATVLKLFKETDALRRPERFGQLLLACVADVRGRLHRENADYPQADWLTAMLTAARAVDAGAIALAQQDKRQIPAAVDAVRVAAIAACKDSLDLTCDAH